MHVIAYFKLITGCACDLFSACDDLVDAMLYF